MVDSTCYSQLDKSSRDIRLLVLLPTRHMDGRLQAKVVTKSLASDPKYEALSYTWGEPDHFDYKIWVNGNAVPIRQNLLCALRVLQKTTERILWIDALCINQNDDTERNHQVGMMGDIYRKAERVVSWLGTPDIIELGKVNLDVDVSLPRTTNSPAFTFLSLASVEAFAQDTDISSKRKSWDDKQWALKHVRSAELEGTRRDLIHIFNLDYWTRMWIVQEVCLARHLELCYGTDSVNWSVLKDYITAIASFRSLLDTQYAEAISTSYASAVHYIEYYTFSQLVTSGDNFKEMIEATTKFACHNRKDKIYALLGLQNSSIKLALRVDYASSLYDLYCEVMELWITQQEFTSLVLEEPAWSEINKFSRTLLGSLVWPSNIGSEHSSTVLTPAKKRKLSVSEDKAIVLNEMPHSESSKRLKLDVALQSRSLGIIRRLLALENTASSAMSRSLPSAPVSQNISASDYDLPFSRSETSWTTTTTTTISDSSPFRRGSPLAPLVRGPISPMPKMPIPKTIEAKSFLLDYDELDEDELDETNDDLSVSPSRENEGSNRHEQKGNKKTLEPERIMADVYEETLYNTNSSI